MDDLEVFIDTFEPDSWANVFSTTFTDEGVGVKHNLKSMGYDGDILIRQKGEEKEETWGIERKTFTDALNSWMGKRLIRQMSDLSEKVTHPILIVIEEPEKRLSSSPNNPYRKFSKHIPNLESHLNRISLEICPLGASQIHAIICFFFFDSPGEIEVNSYPNRRKRPRIKGCRLL